MDFVDLNEPSSCKRSRPKNDVFVNYLFEDIGNSFVSHLKGALNRNGFSISDHTMLPKGQNESSELLKDVKDSEIYLVVFSIKYAFSVRCLDELVLIMACSYLPKFKIKRKVFPIFFNVNPSHVRSQEEGFFKEAFQSHNTNAEPPERVEKWKQTLKDVGQLSGLTFENGDEADFIQQILQKLKQMQNPLELFDVMHPVGIESRVEDIISKLRLGDNVFTIVAVFGICGSGKTTIVKAVFDRIVADFDTHCFIENIHNYEYSGPNWKVVLQKDVFCQLTGNHQFYNVGVAKIKKLMSCRKVLLVLDDVDKFEQLQALGIHHHRSFGCGSRIIVTTRNKQSLSNLPHTPYQISLLNKRESFELFTQLAFGKDDPIDEKFVYEILFYAGGIPLVLEVWGRHFICHERKQWPSILETLKRIPRGDVQKQLQISYDSLPNRSKKSFLDIACGFFDAMKKDLVVKVSHDEESCFPDAEIQYLVDKSLVKLTYNELSMHHAIREMGQELVRQENVDEPGKRSRLMDQRDIVRILRDCSGTESVEGIRLDYGNHEMEERVTVQVEAFKKMSNLRFIRLLDYESRLEWSSSSSSSSNDDMSSFSFKKLKYLEWSYFPFKCLDNIDMGNVVVINLQHSNLKILWKGFKSLKKLRILDVSDSSSLTKTGNFSGLDNLEKLLLRGCKKLEELDSSIGCLEKLEELDLSHCRQLKIFPCKMIGKLTSLSKLNLENCSNLLKISHELGSLKLLRYFNLRENEFLGLPDSLSQLCEPEDMDVYDCTSLKLIPKLSSNTKAVTLLGYISLVNLPSNMSEFQSLTTLVLDGCYNLEPKGFMKVTGLRNLHYLSMRNCNVAHVSSEIGNLESLEYLDLSENSFSNLLDSFSNLSELVELKMNYCSQLELLPLLPSKLTRLEACGCCSLDVTPYDSMQKAYIFRSKLFEESFFTKDESLWMSLSGEEVPGWCSYTSNGHVLSFVAPVHLDKKICGVIFCATFTKVLNDHLRKYLSPTMLNKTKETSHSFNSSPLFNNCSLCIMFSPLNDTTLVVEAGDNVILQFENKYSSHLDVLSSGLRLIYECEVVDYALCIQNVIEGYVSRLEKNTVNRGKRKYKSRHGSKPKVYTQDIVERMFKAQNTQLEALHRALLNANIPVPDFQPFDLTSFENVEDDDEEAVEEEEEDD